MADKAANDIRKMNGVQIQMSRIIAAASPPAALESQSIWIPRELNRAATKPPWSVKRVTPRYPIATSVVNKGAVNIGRKKLLAGNPIVIIQASVNPRQASIGIVIPTKSAVMKIAYQNPPSVNTRI